MHRVIVVGSPRVEGRSSALAEELFNACIDECPDDGVSIVSVASVEVKPCVGCNACAKVSEQPGVTLEEGDPLTPCVQVQASDAQKHRCVFEDSDDMAEVRKHLDAADQLIVVSPVYFAGVPSQFKALLDRLQPYYYSNARAQQPKRPLIIHVVGEGDDPYGFDALQDIVQSACGVAGFQLEYVYDWVGKIAPDGTIEADADVYEVDAAEAIVYDEIEMCDNAGLHNDAESYGDAGLHDDGELYDDIDSREIATTRTKESKKRPRLSLDSNSTAPTHKGKRRG